MFANNCLPLYWFIENINQITKLVQLGILDVGKYKIKESGI
jgi:hypothetical protein